MDLLDHPVNRSKPAELHLDGKYVDAYMGLGGVYYEKGDYEQEVASYEKAAQLDPGN